MAANSLVQYSVVDAFTDRALYRGNPALVCFLDQDHHHKSDAWLQAVASEFNIPATSFLNRIDIPADSHDTAEDIVNGVPRFSLRWFSPVTEVPICGHATLAASHALFTSPQLSNSDMIEFTTLSGILTAKKVLQNSTDKLKPGFLIELDFPTVPFKDEYTYNNADQIITTISKATNRAFSVIDMKMTAKDDLFVVLQSAKAVESFEPQFDEIKKCHARGVIITGIAPSGSEFDFYSRFFYPKLGVDEDQVCGSAHCSLVVYWSEKLGKDDFVAKAASPRGGVVNLHFDKKKQRVFLRGKAATVAKGYLLV